MEIDPFDVIETAMDCIPDTIEGHETKLRVTRALSAYFRMHSADPLSSPRVTALDVCKAFDAWKAKLPLHRGFNHYEGMAFVQQIDALFAKVPSQRGQET